MKKIVALFVAILAIVAVASCASALDAAKATAELSAKVSSEGISGVEVKAVDTGVMVTAGDLNFPANSATLTSTTQGRLDKLGKLLKSYASHKILIVGHTAMGGTDTSDVELSKKRAQAVADFLVKKGYLKASKITVDGKGGAEPVATNETEEGKAKNRRVEITILAQ